MLTSWNTCFGCFLSERAVTRKFQLVFFAVFALGGGFGAPAFSQAPQTNAPAVGVWVTPIAHVTQSFAGLSQKRLAAPQTLGEEEEDEPLPIPHIIPQDLLMKGTTPLPNPPELKSTVIPPLAPPVSLDFDALPASGWMEPPDTNGTVGPNHLMTALNDRVRVQDKGGAELETIGLTTFWHLLGISRAVDPRTIYDPHHQRFVFVAAADNRSASSGVLLAVSASSDPLGDWYLYKYDADPADATWADFPNVGLTADRITVTANMFSLATNQFSGVLMLVVPTAEVANGGAGGATRFFNANIGGNLAPCLTYDGDTTQYLVSVVDGQVAGAGYLRLFTLSGSPSAPVFTGLTHYPTSAPWNDTFPMAPQKGSTVKVSTNDDRILNAVRRNGSIWCVHTIGLPYNAPTHTAVQWWKIDPASGTAQETGIVEDPTGATFFFFPSIAVNRDEEVLLGFSGSSATMYPSAFYSLRSAALTGGVTSQATVYVEGQAPYSSYRWGDYSASCVDPVDDTTLWTIQEYAASPESTWSTRWAKVSTKGQAIEPLVDPIVALGWDPDAVPALDRWALVGLLGGLALAGTLMLRAANRGLTGRRETDRD